MTGPLVSVVTPVYNGAEYLRICIESVLAQTYTNWDYTIVDNCSTDETLAIAHEYAAKDPRIRVRTNDTFVRVIENYNNAFRAISPGSAYCKVVAADDWLFPECLERMVALAQRCPSAAIIGAYQIWGEGVTTPGLSFPKTVVSGRDVCRMQLLGGPYIFGTPTTVLYRSDIVRKRHAFFNEANLHADDEACLEFLDGADFGFVHQVLTFRRLQERSMTSFSERFDTYAAGLLRLVVAYGPKYLTVRERESRTREVLKDYYSLLARRAFTNRDPEFWRYHRTKLAELGHPFSRARLAAAMLALAGDLLLNPKLTLKKLIRQRRAAAGRANDAPADRSAMGSHLPAAPSRG